MPYFKYAKEFFETLSFPVMPKTFKGISPGQFNREFITPSALRDGYSKSIYGELTLHQMLLNYHAQESRYIPLHVDLRTNLERHAEVYVETLTNTHRHWQSNEDVPTTLWLDYEHVPVKRSN